MTSPENTPKVSAVVESTNSDTDDQTILDVSDDLKAKYLQMLAKRSLDNNQRFRQAIDDQ